MVTRKNVFYSDEKGNINAEAWIHHVAAQRPASPLRLIRNATALSRLTGAKKLTPLGTSCLQQGLVMADLLVDLMLDEDTICAALLYHSVYYADLDLKIVEEQLNPNVTKLLKGALRMNNISHFLGLKNLRNTQLEKFRKMLFSMANDMRVVLLKLAERVAWMRAVKTQGLRTLPTRHYAKETLAIYASLANRLGIYAVRYELEDLAMEQLAPRLYKRMANLFKERLLDRENYLKELALAIEITLPKIGITDFKVTSRVKNFYGAYRKMCHKKLKLQDVYDLNAIRIVVNTISECYQVTEVLQTLWTPVEEGLDDYIKYPKENHYRSIHLAVYGESDKIIEIQVRTFEMDRESEHGLAAHWEYKEDVTQKPDYHTKIAWLRQVLTWQKELVKRGMYVIPELTASLDDRIYVLTTNNDIIDLPKEATALDYAYYLDAETGHHCETVIVDGKEQSLTYVLHTGECVEVITGEQFNIRWDWLNPDLGYLNTAHAKAKVLHWFQQKDYYQHVITGQLLLEKGCQQLGIEMINQDQLARALSFPSKKEMLAALGSGELRIVQVLHALYTYSKRQQHYPSLEGQSKEAMVAREEIPTYDAAQIAYTEIEVLATSNTHVLDEILSIIKKQFIVLSFVSAQYEPQTNNTTIHLKVNSQSIDRIEKLVTYLKTIENVIQVNYSLEK